MTIRVGVIGVGNIGQEHVRRLARNLSGVQVGTIADADPARAESVAREVPGARLCRTGHDQS